MSRRWHGFPLQLFVLIILPLSILLVGISFGSVALHQRAMRTLVGERDERASRAAAEALTEQLKHKAATVHSLALQSAATGDPEETLADTSSFLPDFDGGLAIFDERGVLVASSSDKDFWEDRAIPQLLLSTAAFQDSQFEARFFPAFLDSASGEHMMLVAASLPDNSAVIGAFSPASLARRTLADIFSTSDEATAFIVDSEGRMLFQVGDDIHSRLDPSMLPGVEEALRGDSGTTYLAVDGEEHVIAFSPVSPVNWALVFEEPWRAVTDPLLRTTELIPLILVPVLIIALVGLWFGVRQIVQPLQSLENKATQLAWGDFEAIEEPVGGISEIRRLQNELIHMAQKVRAAQQSLRGYLEAITAGQEEERLRLARELHDDTIQSLIALNQQGQLAQMTLDDHPAHEQLRAMQELTTQIIADLRRMTRDLRPSYLEDLGLVPALDMLARDLTEGANIPVNFRVLGPEQRLKPEIELTLYRMAQEALSNVARHSHASSAEVSLQFGEEELTLIVEDDGVGFAVPESPSDMAPAGHFGLLGLYERAELIDGRLMIRSEPDRGTKVILTLPDHEAA